MLMNRWILTFSLALLFQGAAWGEIDLHPRYVTINVGGGVIHRVYFAEGNKNYAVTIDSETSVVDGNGGAVFRFKSIEGAEVSLRRSIVGVTAPFTEERMPDYRQAARELLGRAATAVDQSPPVLNVFPINGWSSLRFSFQYLLGGVSYSADVTFLNVSKNQQIVVIAGARGKDFENVRARADKMMKRWHEVLPADELGYN